MYIDNLDILLFLLLVIIIYGVYSTFDIENINKRRITRRLKKTDKEEEVSSKGNDNSNVISGLFGSSYVETPPGN